MYHKSSFIMKPLFNNLKASGLNYKDILTYISIRSFLNSHTKLCYPSQESISKRSGLSKKFVTESIKRLNASGFLKNWKVMKYRASTRYTFTNYNLYQKIPTEVFEATDLSSTEISALLVVPEYCDSMLECDRTLSDIAQSCGLEIKVLQRNVKSLVEKAYLVQYEKPDLNSNTITIGFRLTTKINWYKTNIVCEVDTTYDSHMKDISTSITSSYKANGGLNGFTKTG